MRRTAWFKEIPPPLVAVVVVAMLWAGLGVLTAANAFGRNITGTVACASGDVMGVFIEAERMPRVRNSEMQSGFAHWRQHTSSSQSAVFDYWLPFGGAYSIHFGCGVLQQPGATLGWASDNPVNNEPATVIVTDCRPA